MCVQEVIPFILCCCGSVQPIQLVTANRMGKLLKFWFISIFFSRVIDKRAYMKYDI